VSSRPRLRTRHTRVSKTFGVSDKGTLSREIMRSAGSSEKGPNSYISFSINDIRTPRKLQIHSKPSPKTFRRHFDYIGYVWAAAQGSDQFGSMDLQDRF